MHKKKLAQVFHFALFGRREEKYDFLLQHSINDIQWSELEVKEPNYFLVKKDFCSNESYKIGFSICDLFPVNNTGIETGRDDFFIDWNNELLSQKVRNVFLNKNDNNLSSRFKITNTTSFRFKENLSNSEYTSGRVQKILYRPFDFRFIYYDQKLLRRASYNTIKHLMQDNLAITSCRQQSTFDFQHILISNCIIERCTVSLQTKETGYVFPLYLYPEPNAQQTIDEPAGRVPNLNMEIVHKIADKLGLSFVPEKNSPPSNGARNSPPSEGCPQGGVVGSPPPEGWSKTGVVINSTHIIRNFVENLPYNPALKQRARDKRKAGILSEVLFWQQVHKGMFHKIDFDRQRIIGNYIVDFYVKTLGLVVEIDGSSHDNKVEYDRIRQQYLESFGLRVYRITDIDVKKNLSWVMAELEKYIVKEYGECATPVFDHPSGGGECTTPVFDHPSGGGECTTPVFDHPSGGGECTTPVFDHPSGGGECTTPPCGHPSEGGEFRATAEGREFVPVDLLDYIYAVLHSPSYREKYKEFLKIDFPRVPYPKDKTTFWQLVELGGEIRQIHLLESPVVNNFITKYPAGGSNHVEKVRFEISENETQNSGDSTLGKVWINDEQYFADVPQVAWEFYIGGYQPAQKWLKDRKDRELQIEDILHYQKIIVALFETDRLMKEIDQIDL